MPMADRPRLLENIPATSAEADVPVPGAEGNGSQGGQAEEHQAPLAWWQLRFWWRDMNVLARVRDSLLPWSPGPTGPARLHELAAQARSAAQAAADASEVAAAPSLCAAVPSAAPAPLATPRLAGASSAGASLAGASSAGVPPAGVPPAGASAAGVPPAGASAAGAPPAGQSP